MIDKEKIIRQKEELDKFRPFTKNINVQLRDYFKIGLTYSSNALEGNSLTESETKVVIEDGLTIGGKPLKDHLEAFGHSRAYDYIFTLKDKTITEEDILAIHRLFYEKIDLDNAGVYRKEIVFISGSKYVPPKPEQVPELMKDFVKWFSENENKINTVEFAALVHLKFVFIHPFIDGNGRVARLLMNLALIRGGYLIAIIPPVLRSEYISLLEKAHENKEKFIDFIADRVYETQKDIIRMLK